MRSLETFVREKRNAAQRRASIGAEGGWGTSGSVASKTNLPLHPPTTMPERLNAKRKEKRL